MVLWFKRWEPSLCNLLSPWVHQLDAFFGTLFPPELWVPILPIFSKILSSPRNNLFAHNSQNVPVPAYTEKNSIYTSSK